MAPCCAGLQALAANPASTDRVMLQHEVEALIATMHMCPILLMLAGQVEQRRPGYGCTI